MNVEINVSNQLLSNGKKKVEQERLFFLSLACAVLVAGYVYLYSVSSSNSWIIALLLL